MPGGSMRTAPPPVAPPIMAIAAHPDDIESWCGGTLAGAIDSGATVRLLLVTSGEHGTGDPTADPRPRQAIEQTRAWARGEITMSQSRAAGGYAMAAARYLSGAARYAAYAAGQAAVVAHVAAHELGAAAYAIKAARAAVPKGEGERAGRLECRWQRDQLPEAIRALVLDDQRVRNDICWSVFDC
jgi:GlcNAc-PI de-N-acetylase